MKKTLVFLFAIATVSLFSCKKDEHSHTNESELITTVRYTLVPANGGTPVVFTFKDTDGDGGNPPLITNGTLSANTVYNGSLEILNESKNPADDITKEIQTEADEHQFFFTPTGVNLAVQYTDKDTKNRPIGLKTQLSTQTASIGKLKVTLRHKPNKEAANVASGNIVNAGGETDIEVNFDVTIR